jgi:hypothetical protein
MASISYRKSQMLAREIRSKMKVIKGPLDYGLVKLHERRSSPSPAMDMTGDLGVFMVRKALALYGRQYARCFDFGSKVAAQANRRKAEAEWAVYALNEFLDMRAEHYPPRSVLLQLINYQSSFVSSRAEHFFLLFFSQDVFDGKLANHSRHQKLNDLQNQSSI